MSPFSDRKQPSLDLKWMVLSPGDTTPRSLRFTTKKHPGAPAAGAAVAPVPSAARPTNAIAVGDLLRLELRSDTDGYLHLFDFGTSGRVLKLFPNPRFATADNRIEAGRTYAMPGELLPVPAFAVSGPTTAESGRLERLLAVVTRDPVDLSEAAVGGAGAAFATRGGFDAAEEAVASLFDLPDGDWTYGLLETEVIHG